MVDIETGWLVGALLGLRHALEPDHLAAVGAMLPGERGLRRGALLGASWGLGHTLALLGVAALLSLLRAAMPAWLTELFELGVAVMLIALGGAALRRAYLEGRAGAPRDHVHGAARHAHAGPAAHVHLGGLTLARRPLLVGFLHGLAGSGALTALVLSGLPSALSRLCYVALFGAGSICGMALLTGLCGLGLSRILRRPGAARWVSAVAGASSAALGVLWAYPSVARLLG